MVATMAKTRPPKGLDPVDLDALQRALDAEGGRAEQIKHSGWLYAAEGAAYSQQYKALQLKPWQFTPCWVGLDDLERFEPGDHSRRWEAARLLQKLLDAGLSRYQPPPPRPWRRSRRTLEAPASTAHIA
jgi:hypothetical protein